MLMVWQGEKARRRRKTSPGAKLFAYNSYFIEFKYTLEDEYGRVSALMAFSLPPRVLLLDYGI